jgi:predicted acetyltransferase
VTLRLRPFGPDDEGAARAGHDDMAREGFTFLLDFDRSMNWDDWLARVAEIREGERLRGDHVRAAFLCAEVGGHLVGRVSIRFELNEFLAREGGHIGYAVLAPYRGRGYATATLCDAVALARESGLDRVLVVCDDANVASAAVIERAGGVLERVVHETEVPYRRYWIDADQ